MFYHAYQFFSFVVSVVAFGCLVYQYALAQKRKPTVSKADIVYEEWFASGHSDANLLTKMGGGRNCVRLIVTSEFLIVTTWLPFALFSAFYDMEHVVPLNAILSIESKRLLNVDYLLLTYRDSLGRTHTISLAPRDLSAFLAAIGRKISVLVQ